MRISVLSDVHANLEALDAVLADVEQQRCDALVCLGDFVGYGPDPIECVARLRGRLRAAVVGNHDRAAVGGRLIDDFNASPKLSWTNTSTQILVAYLLDSPNAKRWTGVTLMRPATTCGQAVVDRRTAATSPIRFGSPLSVTPTCPRCLKRSDTEYASPSGCTGSPNPSGLIIATSSTWGVSVSPETATVTRRT
jgi:hypothetical protein